MFPTFLGIGAPRAGTTWLHDVLASHPDVYVPADRKEIQFFDRSYDRGLNWYEAFFPEQPGDYRAVGEISPMYLSHPEAPARIAELGTVRHLIVQLRDPVDRAYSEYLWRVNRGGYRGTIQEFYAEKPRLLRASTYSPGLTRYLEHFDRSSMLVLIFEEIFEDTARTLQRIGAFLDVDPDRFDLSIAARPANPGTTARRPRLSRMAHRAGGRLRERGSDRLANWSRDTVLGRALTSGRESTPELQPMDREYLQELVGDDAAKVEGLLNIDLARWRSDG